MLALRSRAVILPTLIQTKNYRIRLFSKITIRFGKPIRPEEYATGENCASEYVRVSALAFRQICALAGADFPAEFPPEKETQASSAGSGCPDCPGSESKITSDGSVKDDSAKREENAATDGGNSSDSAEKSGKNGGTGPC